MLGLTPLCRALELPHHLVRERTGRGKRSAIRARCVLGSALWIQVRLRLSSMGVETGRSPQTFVFGKILVSTRSIPRGDILTLRACSSNSIKRSLWAGRKTSRR